MDSDSSSEDGADDVQISPKDYICQKLIERGVPDEYANHPEQGLLSYLQENRLRLREVIEALCDAMFTTVDKRGLTVDRNIIDESLALLKTLMFKDDPQFALMTFSENEDSRRAVCGAVWGSNDLAYRCQTCEHDPTCAICVSCFQHGNHEGHDYSIMYTGGGCCDCGDVTAWKREGFCSRHAGWEQVHLPTQQVVNTARPVLDVLFSYWKDMLMTVEAISTDVHANAGASTLSRSIIMMLIYFCTCSDGLLSLVSKAMMYSVDLLPILIRTEKFLDEGTVTKLHELLLKLTAEPVFKYEFAKIYVQHYPNAIQEVVKNCNDSSIEKCPIISTFSVQLFTVPTLTSRLVREMNLLGVFLECLENILTSCIGKDMRLQASKWYNLYETSIRVIEDLRFSLSHNEVQQYVILREQQDVFKRWLSLLGLVQGMDSQKRITTGNHIEQENLNFQKTFFLGQLLGKVSNLLIEGSLSVGGIISDLGTEMLEDSDLPRYLEMERLSQQSSSSHFILTSKSKGWTVGSQSILPTLTWLILECFRIIEKFMEPLISKANVASPDTTSVAGCALSSLTKKLFERKGSKNGVIKSFPIECYDASPDPKRKSKGRRDEEEHDFQANGNMEVFNWPRISYDVSLQEISFHIPLHRFLSLLLHKAMTLSYNENETFQSYADLPHASGSGSHIFFNKVLGNCHPYVFSSFLMEHPLQLRVFCAQVFAGMWARNGDMCIYTLELYYEVYWCHTSLEIDLFLLQCSAAMAPPDLFLKRIAERFGLLDYLSLKPSTDNENEVVLMKEMLILIIQLVKERRFCGLSPTENLQRELVQRLALGDATRSQLVKALPRDLAKSKSLQEVVDIVAVYVKPSSVKQGKYSLRRPYWKDLDLYFPRWKSRDLQIAEERYLHICKVSPSCNQLPRWSKIYDPLSALSRIATSKYILQIVRSVLFYAASTEMSALCRAPDGVFISALHLLSLALDVCHTLNDSGNSCATASFPTDTIPVLEFATEIICAEVGKESGISRQQSLISLLVLLMNKHKNEHNDVDLRLGNISSLIRDMLKKFSQMDAVCMKELKQLSPDLVFEMPEDSSPNSTLSIQPSSESQTRKLKAREKQAAILAKMKAEQLKFAASFKHTENDNTELTNSNIDQALEESVPVCSLCRDTDSKSSLSFLVLLQKSRLSSFVSRGPPTWKEIDILADRPSIPSDMVIDASSSSNVVQMENIHDLHQHEGDAFMFTAINQQKFKTFYSSSTMEIDIPPIETIEKDIYLSVQEEINLLKSRSVMLVDDQKDVSSLGTESLKSGNNKESTSFEDCIAQFSDEAKKTHNPIEGPRHVEDASPVSTIPFLTDCDGIYISSCGHAMHLECYNIYMYSLRQRHSRRFGVERHRIFDPDQGELLCPVCRRFNNSILPVFSKDLAASKYWNLGTSLNSHSTSDAGISSFSDLNYNVSRFHNALFILRSIGNMVRQSKYSPAAILKFFPKMMGEPVKTSLSPIIQKLSRLYFNHRHGKETTSKTTHSIMIWDTLRYSLILTEISSRERGHTCFSDSSLTCQGFERELRSSNGVVLAELLQIAHLSRSFDGINLLIRFIGCQLFADSTCASVLGELDIPHFDWRQDSLPFILEERTPSIMFWKFAADPIISHEPFSSLMWILFSLPAPFMLSMGTFDSLVHLFYVVNVVQALITCRGMCSYCQSSFNNSHLHDVCNILGDSDLARQYFVSNLDEDSCSPKDMIRNFTFPYLRRCALLKELLKLSLPVSFLTSSEESTLVINQRDARGFELENMFQICQLDTIFNDELVQRMALKWCQHFLRAFTVHKPGNVFHMTGVVPFRLVQLPHLYQELLERYIKRQCPNCGDVPDIPVLCLLCGRLCSYGHTQCCRENTSKAHAVACGAGIGVFLLVRKTTILLQRSGRHASWPSLYLDAFGEEDHDMSRGRPLYLSEERYLDLTNLVASHGMDHSSEVLRRTMSGYIEF